MLYTVSQVVLQVVMSELWWAEVGEFLYRNSENSAVDLDVCINQTRTPTQTAVRPPSQITGAF